MPICENGPAANNYEEAGSGLPLPVIPGGGLNSTIAGHTNHAFGPLEELSNCHRIIGLDGHHTRNQRN